MAETATLDTDDNLRVLITLDWRGDNRYEFSVTDTAAVAAAEERFRQLTGSGFRAAVLTEDGSPGRLINKFDPEARQTLFIPQLKGG
jgi:hypothetical protein